jgi:hypothetical protein
MSSVLSFISLVKDYPEADIWKLLVEELLKCEEFETCSLVILAMPPSVCLVNIK